MGFDSEKLRKNKNISPVQVRRLFLFVAFMLSARLALLVFLPDPEQRRLISNIFRLIEGLGTAAVLYYTSRVVAQNNRMLSKTWFLWTIGMLCTFVGDLWWAIASLILKEPPTPSLADLFYVFFYGFAWAGLYFYPLSPQRGSEYKYIWLDNLIVILGSGLLYWVILIEPIVRTNWNDLSQLSISMIYPGLNLLMLWSLLTFFRNRPEQSHHLPILMLGMSLLIILLANSMFIYQGLVGTYSEGNAIDFAWSVSYMLFLLGGVAQMGGLKMRPNPSRATPAAQLTHRNRTWPVYLPYFWLIVAGLVVFLHGFSPAQAFEEYLVISVIVFLVVLRQVLTLRDNETLFMKAQNDLQERNLAEEALRRAHAGLEQRVAERTAELTEVNAKMELLNENLTLSNQSLRQEVAEREKIQLELDHARLRQEYMLSNTPAVIYSCEVDEDSATTFISKNVQAQLGYAPEAFTQKPNFWMERIHPQDLERVRENLRHSLEKRVLTNEYRFLCGNGDWHWIQDDLQVIFDAEGAPVEAVGSMIDITLRKRLEEELRNSLNEKEVLLKEIHHRVKNNLQVISSLLNLQSAQIKDPPTLQIFRDSQNRVRTMALIHEKLYQSSDLARIDFRAYVQSLGAYLMRSFAAEAHGINFRTQIEGLTLQIDQAIPCGLIINELVSNSLKYAFPQGRPGEVSICFTLAADHQFHLVVADNGVGIPESIDIENTTSLGLQLVSSLVEQLDGTLRLNQTAGTEFEIMFPEQAAER